MKLKFIATAKGRDWKVGDTADFNDKSDVEMSYARKYIARGWAEDITPAGKAAERDKAGEKDGAGKGSDTKQ